MNTIGRSVTLTLLDELIRIQGVVSPQNVEVDLVLLGIFLITTNTTMAYIKQLAHTILFNPVTTIPIEEYACPGRSDMSCRIWVFRPSRILGSRGVVLFFSFVYGCVFCFVAAAAAVVFRVWAPIFGECGGEAGGGDGVGDRCARSFFTNGNCDRRTGMAEGRCLLLLDGSAGDKDSTTGVVAAIAGIVRSLRGILVAHEKLKRFIGLARGTGRDFDTPYNAFSQPIVSSDLLC